MLALPVELLRFTATVESPGVWLDWLTATEANNDFFQIEHSLDGASFKALAQLKGAGNSQVPHSYRFLHKGAPAGNNYYRLKQVDFDGVFEYSDVIAVQVGGAVKFQAFPNPASGALRVQSHFEEPLRFRLFDIFGRLLLQGAVGPLGDAGDLSPLSAGTYHLQLENEEGEVLGRERILLVNSHGGCLPLLPRHFPAEHRVKDGSNNGCES